MQSDDFRFGATTPHLRAWREYRLLSQGELAKRARVDRGTVIAAEHGRRIRLTCIGRLANALGLDRRTLTFERPPDPPDTPDRAESSAI